MPFSPFYAFTSVWLKRVSCFSNLTTVCLMSAAKHDDATAPALMMLSSRSTSTQNTERHETYIIRYWSTAVVLQQTARVLHVTASIPSLPPKVKIYLKSQWDSTMSCVTYWEVPHQQAWGTYGALLKHLLRACAFSHKEKSIYQVWRSANVTSQLRAQFSSKNAGRNG